MGVGGTGVKFHLATLEKKKILGDVSYVAQVGFKPAMKLKVNFNFWSPPNCWGYKPVPLWQLSQTELGLLQDKWALQLSCIPSSILWILKASTYVRWKSTSTALHDTCLHIHTHTVKKNKNLKNFSQVVKWHVYCLYMKKKHT